MGKVARPLPLACGPPAARARRPVGRGKTGFLNTYWVVNPNAVAVRCPDCEIEGLPEDHSIYVWWALISP